MKIIMIIILIILCTALITLTLMGLYILFFKALPDFYNTLKDEEWL